MVARTSDSFSVEYVPRIEWAGKSTPAPGPRTDRWLWFVVANVLYPMGYQADLGADRDGEPTHSP